MAVSAQRIQASYSPQVAEAVALLRGIILAAETGLSPIVVESDPLGVVNLVNAGSSCSTEIRLVIDDIRDLSQGLGGSQVLHVSRKANYVPHFLSKMAWTLISTAFG
ncbi:hypothetical protein Dsin_022764 [Dipteronia sinensis]|uniref:RNase H type-1 domain-containing protein n=1 Tax=Dipteronia sinensis TaxID=43782 RepID=A0AAE0A341_9ROSI|nr:hypothetical protein Dsin_022764 [Dipteronia sinensis]